VNKSAKNGVQSVREVEDTLPAKDGLLPCSNYSRFTHRRTENNTGGRGKVSEAIQRNR